MAYRYTSIPGLTFIKGCDLEYVEHWESVSEAVVIRKTICGDTVTEGAPLQMLTVTGSGNVLPKCSLTIGDVVNLIPLNKTPAISARLEKWSYKYSPWEFKYSWMFTFKEVK